MLRSVNRVLVCVAGLALLALGGAVLAAGLGLSTPSWWPFSGPHAVLLSAPDRQRYRDESWWWPAVIAGLAVIILLALWWLFAQLRGSRLSEVLVDSGDGEGARLRGRALEDVVSSEAEALHGVDRAKVALRGRRTAPEARVVLVLEAHAQPTAALSGLATGALAHARDSAGLAQFPAEIRLRAAKHRAQRVS
ncbi:alkaline shock response membrane anchor protein AmaP [Streptomyces sp. NPDC051322]|uniref:alkaline shock response membrane anchor protein AmaP n=1 Tax=Streptomyces sp. NPDC051322 TaxID=3154645 RepID=UPI00344E9419